MSTIVRPAKSNEIDAIVSLWKEFVADPSAIDEPIPTHTENTKKQTQFLGELIDHDPRQVLVAEEGGQLVGYLACKREVKPLLETQKKQSYIANLYVKASHRKKGIGKELLQVCLKDLNDLGPREVELYVWVSNEDAMRLYKAMGFKEHMVGMKLTTAG